MADGVYTAGIRKLIDDGWVTSDPRVLLLDAAGTYTFDPDHAVVDDLTPAANELGGPAPCPGYIRVPVSTPTLLTDLGSDQVEGRGLNATFVVLGSETAPRTIAAAVVFFHDTDDTTSVPFLFMDAVFPRAANGQDLTLQWSFDGLFTVSQT